MTGVRSTQECAVPSGHIGGFVEQFPVVVLQCEVALRVNVSPHRSVFQAFEGGLYVTPDANAVLEHYAQSPYQGRAQFS